MYQIDNSTAASAQPAPSTAGTPGFFTDGSPAGGVPATVLPAEWLNAVQQELINAAALSGDAPSKTAFNQIVKGIKKTIQSLLGNRQSSITYASGATTNLTASQAGSLIVFQGGQLNLPSLSSCPIGASFDILTTFSGTVTCAGADKIQFDGNSIHNAASLAVSGTSFTIVNGGTAWFYLSGTAAFKYSPEFGSLLTGAGYQKNPSGLIEQWGTVNSGSGGVTPITFPMVFPNVALNMSVTVVGTGSASNYQGTSSGPTTTGATLYGLFNGSGASGVPLAWRCIGY